MGLSTDAASPLTTRYLERSPWLGWTAIAVAINIGLLAVTNSPTDYTMTGGFDDCFGIGSSASDIILGTTQVLAVILCGRKGPKALWTGIVTTHFVQHVPAAVLMACAVVVVPIPIGNPLNSAVFWWTARAIIATGAIIWLCMKREGPSARTMSASALMSLALLGFLSLQWDDFQINPILPWKTLHQLFSLKP